MDGTNFTRFCKTFKRSLLNAPRPIKVLRIFAMNGELDNYLNLCYNYNQIVQVVSLNKNLVKLREAI